MHASHTTWLINSNLNGRGLTSYTHAFWWCLEKMLQHLQWAGKTCRLEQSHECESKKCHVSWCDRERLIAQRVTAGSCGPKFGKQLRNWQPEVAELNFEDFNIGRFCDVISTAYNRHTTWPGNDIWYHWWDDSNRVWTEHALTAV